MPVPPLSSTLFFFNDTATTEIYTLSLHDALPIYDAHTGCCTQTRGDGNESRRNVVEQNALDRKSTRLNSSLQIISYAVFCLKKKKQERTLIVNTEHAQTLVMKNPAHAAPKSLRKH